MVQCDFARDGALDPNYLQVIANFCAAFDLLKLRRLLTVKTATLRQNRHRKLFRIVSRGARMVGVRNDDASQGRFPAKPFKLRNLQQDWIDKVNFSGGQDRAGTEFSLYRGVVILPNKEIGEGLIQVASDGHYGASLRD